MNITFFIISLCLLINTGCGIPYKVIKIKGIDSGFIIYRMKKNSLKDLDKNTWDALQLNAQFGEKNGETFYSLIVEYSGGSWLFIEKGESLQLNIDGETIVLSGDGSAGNRTLEFGQVVERAWYDISTEKFKKIAYGKVGKLTLTGKKKQKEFYFREDNFKGYSEFYKEFILERKEPEKDPVLLYT